MRLKTLCLCASVPLCLLALQCTKNNYITEPNLNSNIVDWPMGPGIVTVTIVPGYFYHGGPVEILYTRQITRM